jgi:hypothetical protein
MCGVIFEERKGLSFTTAAGTSQCSQSINIVEAEPPNPE